MANYKEFLQGNLNKYKAIPFWSWNNALDEGHLIRQIEDMHEAGIGGFIMHARLGMKEEYMGEKWFSCIDACLKKARELEMNAWLYDENGWPSGFVGGKLLEKKEFLAKYLEYKVGDFDTEAMAVYVENPEGYVRVEAPTMGAKEYHNVYLCYSPSNTDILDPAVVSAFIEETYDKYYERFAESFGREMVGFFTDEPQYFRYATPYSPALAEAFAARGENVLDGLVYLFKHDARGYAFREKYYTELNRLYTENFYKRIYDWCTAHNCMLTGHSIEEENLPGQLLGGAAVSPSYEFEHIPGIDHLGRWCPKELGPKQIGSVASQLGKEQVLTETFACCGYDITPYELKGIAEAQYFHGVNLMCHHLYPYSLADIGKTDHPPVFSPQSGWFKGFREFNDYFTRLGALVANTTELYDVAVIHPIHSVWMEWIRSEEAESVQQLCDEFDALLLRMRKEGITFQLVDERILARHGKIENGNLRVGNCVYDRVIVPKMLTMTSTTCGFLKEFKGELFVEGEIPFTDGRKERVALSSNITFEDIVAKKRFSFTAPDGKSFITARGSALGEFLFVKNLSETEPSEVSMPGVSAEYKLLDLTTLTTENARDAFTLAPNGSAIFVKDASAAPATETAEEADVTDCFAVADITKNYLVLDTAEIRKGEAAFLKNDYVIAHFDALLREDYKGKLTVRQHFAAAEPMRVTLMIERANFLSITCNGKALELRKSDFDINFREADMDAVAGENTIEYVIDYYQHEGVHYALFDPEATESLRNCIYYDTAIENAYLFGDFTVDSAHVLHKREGLPALSAELYKNGYPFFRGDLTLRGKLNYGGEGKAILDILGRFVQAEVRVGGKSKVLVMDSKGDITPLLEKGENDVEIILSSSLRNLMGPYHLKDSENAWIGIYAFTFRRMWTHDGTLPKGFSEEYGSVPFGANRIKMQIAK